MSSIRTSTEKLAVLGRQYAWKMAEKLKRTSSPWELEYFKSCLGLEEIRLGNLLSFTNETDYLFLCRKRNTVIDLIHFVLATCIGFATLLMVLLRYSEKPPQKPLGAPGQTIIAVHGEWSNRTRHLLNRISSDLNPVAIVVLGRAQMPTASLAKRWTQEIGVQLPPVVSPICWNAFISVVSTFPKLLASGFNYLRNSPLRPSLRQHGALTFRILLGCVQSQWWHNNAGSGSLVLFGHTGTGDTMQLERAMQVKQSRTIHMVHGLASGPNFVGFSTSAFFHSAFDAHRYETLGHYGHCNAPAALMPNLQRGKQGILLLTNFAHPMNPGYQARGLADEIQVMRDVAQLAIELGSSALPLQWKPHPVIRLLPAQEQALLREKARILGYKEITNPESTLSIAKNSKWVFTTPSTMAVDLLAAGCLPIVLDWQNSAGDEAAGQMKTCKNNIDDLLECLGLLQTPAAYAAMQKEVWNSIGPTCTPNTADLTDLAE